MSIPQEVTFWYRNPLKGYFSIENVFDGVAEQLRLNDDANITKQYVPFTTGSLKALRANRAFAAKNSGSINHITGDIYYVTSSLKGKTILTIHDFVLFRRKVNVVKEQVYKYLWYTEPIKNADIITVISPQIEKELYSNFKVDPKKVRVVSNFYKPYFGTIKKTDYKSFNKALFIGDTEHKNLPTVIKAISGLGIELNIVGNPVDADLALLKEHQVSFLLHSSISDEELGKLYQDCSLLLFPSLYEGFGLPIIEAQAVGLPVITSNIDPMKWVAGSGALLIDPSSISNMREAIIALKENEALSKSMVQEGFLNIERFSLQSVAQQYLACYQALI